MTGYRKRKYEGVKEEKNVKRSESVREKARYG
jgi:hypothetical protein